MAVPSPRGITATHPSYPESSPEPSPPASPSHRHVQKKTRNMNIKCISVKSQKTARAASSRVRSHTRALIQAHRSHTRLVTDY
ncbi:hypothetical protein GDO81_016811 [Engystomops pustulosus]|uniref:Uncharacterized protein n=1 Tax=Engystomops pustulosus TaxID=76066 RepID=A0AAV7ADG0_ENGPU|nr:hypothetical protein GDO81_016811 [Engystomops pustulosus]